MVASLVKDHQLNAYENLTFYDKMAFLRQIGESVQDQCRRKKQKHVKALKPYAYECRKFLIEVFWHDLCNILK